MALIDNTPEMLLADYDLSLFPAKDTEGLRKLLIAHFNSEYLKCLHRGERPNDIATLKSIPAVIKKLIGYEQSAAKVDNHRSPLELVNARMLKELSRWVAQYYTASALRSNISFRDVMSKFTHKTGFVVRTTEMLSVMKCVCEDLECPIPEDLDQPINLMMRDTPLDVSIDMSYFICSNTYIMSGKVYV
jgi:hypothetical protein